MSVELMSKMARRLLSLVGRAKVTTSDDAGPIQTLQGKFNDLEVIDGMPRAAEFGLRLACPLAPILWWCFNGDRSNGVVLGTNHPASRPRNLAEGKLRSIACSVSVFTFLGLALRLRGRAAGDDQNASQITVQCETSVKLIAPGGWTWRPRSCEYPAKSSTTRPPTTRRWRKCARFSTDTPMEAYSADQAALIRPASIWGSDGFQNSMGSGQRSRRLGAGWSGGRRYLGVRDIHADQHLHRPPGRCG